MTILPQLMPFTAQFCHFSIFQTTFDEVDYVRRVSRFLSALRSTNFHYVATAIGDRKNCYARRDVRSTRTTFNGGLLYMSGPRLRALSNNR
jgi:hypothetical protein